jgi:trans-aconitate methyltransferase
MSERQKRWDDAYWQGDEYLSWHQQEAETSLDLITATGVSREARIIDIGGGASVLADGLVSRGYISVTVLDVSPVALDIAKRRMGVFADSVVWVVSDLLEWRPAGAFDLWHDRAVLHFLTDDDQLARYKRTLEEAVPPGGLVVLGTFAEDGPEQCSGLAVRRYSAADQAAFLGEGWSVTETRREAHTTPSGKEQSFQWTVARRK